MFTFRKGKETITVLHQSEALQLRMSGWLEVKQAPVEEGPEPVEETPVEAEEEKPAPATDTKTKKTKKTK